MWVKISKPEDTKKLKVGDGVRVDGKEYKCTHTYPPTDFGFDVDGNLPHGNDVMGAVHVECFEYTIELWEEEETTRNKQYKSKLKEGDACKIAGLTEEQYHQVCKRFIDNGAGDCHYKDGYIFSRERDCVEWCYGSLCHTNSLESNATIYTYEQIMEEESQMLERDKEYDIKLTGEQLAFIWYCTSNTASGVSGVEDLWRKLLSFPNCQENRGCIIRDSLMLKHKDQVYDDYLNKFFTKPETEQEKKIREMEEQYAALGKAIEEVKKGSK